MNVPAWRTLYRQKINNSAYASILALISLFLLFCQQCLMKMPIPIRFGSAPLPSAARENQRKAEKLLA
jgi:hypothetical protein